MKITKLILFLLLSVGVNFKGQAQDENKLHLKSNFFGNKFYKGDTIISVNQVLYEMAPNESVYNLMKSAKTDFVFAQILGATGGILLGWEVGTAIGGGDLNWVVAGVGAAAIAISIPVSINFRKKANSAIIKHNNLIAGANNKPTYHVGFNGRGLRLQYRF